MTPRPRRRVSIEGVRFLTDEWIAALDDAARARTPPVDVDGVAGDDAADPVGGVTMIIEQSVEGATPWRMIIDDGQVRVRRSQAGDDAADVRLSCSEAIARAIASGRRPALDAFINGELRIGGDVSLLLTHRAALESMGDLFAAVRDRTTFD